MKRLLTRIHEAGLGFPPRVTAVSQANKPGSRRVKLEQQFQAASDISARISICSDPDGAGAQPVKSLLYFTVTSEAQIHALPRENSVAFTTPPPGFCWEG